MGIDVSTPSAGVIQNQNNIQPMIFNEQHKYVESSILKEQYHNVETNNINTTIPSIAAIEPVKSRAERGGITQKISNANQQKSTSVGTVNVYPAKGETNYMNFVEMHS